MTRSSLDDEGRSPSYCAAMLSWQMFALKAASLEPSLMELVKMRASQLNRDSGRTPLVMPARKENRHKLGALNVWRESPFFTERERAALAWTEAVTQIAEASASITTDHMPDELYQEVRRQFSEKELLNLTMAITAFYGSNHIRIGGTFVPDEDQLAA